MQDKVTQHLPWLSSEARVVSIYCAALSLLFNVIALIVVDPISSMMIIKERKILGTICFLFSISFFFIFAFKVSRTNLFIVPCFLGLLSLVFPIYLLMQDSRYGFTPISDQSDALPFCKKIELRNYPQTIENNKLVYYPFSNNTGKVIAGLVSSYLLAKVTGRSFLFIPPFPNISLGIYFGGDVNLESPFKILSNMENSKFLDLAYCRYCTKRDYKSTFAEITSKDINEIYPHSTLIVKSNLYFATNLLANPYYRNTLCNNVVNGTLFRPTFFEIFDKEKLDASIHPLQSVFENYDVIGIQINYNDREGVPFSSYKNFFACVQNLAHKYSNPMFFLSTDEPKIFKLAQNYFGSQLYTNPTLNINGSSIQELIFLSHCKELIISSYSTFGQVAAAIGNIKPYVVLRKSAQCYRDINTEPKNPYWHGLSRSGLKHYTSSDTVNFDDSYI